jgi:hypothetical protein
MKKVCAINIFLTFLSQGAGNNIYTVEAEYGGARKSNKMGNFVIFTHNKIL